MNYILIFFVIGILSSNLIASLMPKVGYALYNLKCPLDRVSFNTTKLGYNYLLDQKLFLDFEVSYMYNKPVICPECGYVLDYSDDKLTQYEKSRLKKFLSSKQYSENWKGRSSYYNLGVILERMEKDSIDKIAYTFLKSLWIPTENSSLLEKRVNKCIKYFKKLKNSERVNEFGIRDHIFSAYIMIELYRRLVKFDKAREKIAEFRELDLINYDESYLKYVIDDMEELIEKGITERIKMDTKHLMRASFEDK